MNLCINCSNTLPKNRKKFCSKECSNVFTRLKRKNDKIQENKIFSENISITSFKESINSNIKLIVVDTISYADKCFLNWHIKNSNLKRTYIDKTVKFVRNNVYGSRTIPQLALSIKDLEFIINHLEEKMKETNRVELKLTIKKIYSFRKKWIEKLKGQTSER